MIYHITYSVDGYCTIAVGADSLDEAVDIADEVLEDKYLFEELNDVRTMRISAEDEEGSHYLI